jgi:MFS family permease
MTDTPLERRWAGWLLTLAVALAFADSSIVVLAVPQLLGRFSQSVSALSWIISAYNVAVATTALALPVVLRRRPARRWLLGAEALFVLASAVCAAAPNLPVLVVARVGQGVGAAALLAASLPYLAQLLGGTGRGLAVWAGAAAVGAAVGPALGGLLTQAFSWRAIFVAQLPVGLLALWVLGRRPPDAPATAKRVGAGWAAAAALALLSGALVGSLFLVVVLFIDVWGLSPLAAAGVAATLPVTTAATVALGRRWSVRAAVGGGSLLVAGSLAGLAAIAGRSVPDAVGALAVGGVGLGLALPPLSVLAGGAGRTDVAAGSWSVAVRHAGLVVALVVVAPLFAATLTGAKRTAVADGAEILFGSRAPVTARLALGLDLADTVEHAPAGRLPDLRPVFDRHGARTVPAVAGAYRTVEARTVGTLTGSFRSTFLVCAGLAAAAALAAAWLPAAGSRRRSRAELAGAVVVAAGLLAGVVGTQPTLTPVPHPAACAPIPTGGQVSPVERLLLAGLQAVSCRAGVDPAHLLLVLTGVDQSAGGHDRAQLLGALRTELLADVAAARRHGRLTPLTAGTLSFLLRFASPSSLLRELS